MPQSSFADAGSRRAVATLTDSVSHTGSLVETTLASVIIPGGLMSPNGSIRISLLYGCNASATAKTIRIKYGAATIYSFVATTNFLSHINFLLTNRGDASNQVAGMSTATGAGGGVGVAFTSSVDSSVDQLLTITGELALETDSISVERVIVEVLNQ